MAVRALEGDGDTIYRQQAIDAVVSAMIDGADAELVEGIMEMLPSAQPERKTGRWIYGNDFHWYTASCNKCGYTRKTDIKATRWNEWKFCPSCGVKMEGEDGHR